MFTIKVLLESRSKQMNFRTKDEVCKCCCVLLFQISAYIFIFLQVSYIVRDSNVSVMSERNFLHTPKGVHCSCRNESDCLYELAQSNVLFASLLYFHH